MMRLVGEALLGVCNFHARVLGEVIGVMRSRAGAIPARWEAKAACRICGVSDVERGQGGRVGEGLRDRNWVPLAVAAALVISVVVAALLMSPRSAPAPAATAVNAPEDAYAANLAVSNLVMSESANLAGGKVTYLDGHIANHGTRTVTGITVQVLFHNAAHEVAQNETMPLRFIRMREPYIDTETVAAAPLKAGAEQDFRLIFEKVSPDWDGAYPDVRVLHVDAR
jgi:hypothetical protein